MRKTKRKKNHLAKSKRKGRGIGASKTNAYPPKTKTKLNEEDVMDSELRRMVAVREPNYMPLSEKWGKTPPGIYRPDLVENAIRAGPPHKDFMRWGRKYPKYYPRYYIRTDDREEPKVFPYRASNLPMPLPSRPVPLSEYWWEYNPVTDSIEEETTASAAVDVAVAATEEFEVAATRATAAVARARAERVVPMEARAAAVRALAVAKEAEAKAAAAVAAARAARAKAIQDQEVAYRI